MTKVSHMCFISILGKKYVRDILMALDEHGPLYPSAISNITGCPLKTVCRRLEELEEQGLVEPHNEHLPLKICKITDLGRKSLVVYDICDKLPLLKKNQKIVYHIVSDAPEQHPTTT